VTTVTIGIYLVDDHEIVRRGLADLLNQVSGLNVVGEASCVREASAGIPECRPDVVVMDVRLPDGNGVELCRELASTYPSAATLMLTSYSDDDALLDALIAGARGFVLKNIRGHDLVSAIRTVATGKSLLNTQAVIGLVRRIRSEQESGTAAALLTDQELLIFELIGKGLSNREISSHAELSEKTVKNYVSRILEKLGLERRTQAAVLATKLRAGTSHPDPSGQATTHLLTPSGSPFSATTGTHHAR
jgi:DNA-binding NarL/FixJ family response regulator